MRRQFAQKLHRHQKQPDQQDGHQNGDCQHSDFFQKLPPIILARPEHTTLGQQRTEIKRDDACNTNPEIAKCIAEKRSGVMRTAGEKGTAHLRTSLSHKMGKKKRKTGKILRFSLAVGKMMCFWHNILW